MSIASWKGQFDGVCRIICMEPTIDMSLGGYYEIVDENDLESKVDTGYGMMQYNEAQIIPIDPVSLIRILRQDISLIAERIRRSWVKMPVLPNGISPVDLVILILCSDGYSVNNLTFRWKDALPMHFLRVWKTIYNIELLDKSILDISPLLHGRNYKGFCEHQGIETVNRTPNNIVGDLFPELALPVKGKTNYNPYNSRIGYAGVFSSDIDLMCYIHSLRGSPKYN